MKSKGSRLTVATKQTCYGCGVELYDLPVETIFKKHSFCSRECLHVNYFKFPSLQLTHHEQQQLKKILA